MLSPGPVLDTVPDTKLRRTARYNRVGLRGENPGIFGTFEEYRVNGSHLLQQLVLASPLDGFGPCTVGPRLCLRALVGRRPISSEAQHRGASREAKKSPSIHDCRYPSWRTGVRTDSGEERKMSSLGKKWAARGERAPPPGMGASRRARGARGRRTRRWGVSGGAPAWAGRPREIP